MALRTLSRYLSQTGNNDGQKNQVVGGAGIYYAWDLLSTMVIDQFWVSYQDATGGTLDEYGNTNAALANISVKHLAGDFVTLYNDLTDGVFINSNGDWARVCTTWQQHVSATDDVFKGLWVFNTPVVIPPGHLFQLEYGGDLSGLVNQYAGINGHYLDGPTPWAP